MTNLDVNCPCGSAKKFRDCHGGAMPQGLVPAPPPTITLAQPVITRKLDLAAGQSPAPGFEGVDIWPQSQHVVNLMEYPWPFDDNSVLELHCSHFIEHIPMIYVDERGREVPMGTPGARDALFRFFDECHRILVPDGWMTVIVPNARSDRAFQDPTHRRFFTPANFLYFSKEWRTLNKLDHYAAESDWGVNCQPLSFLPEIQLLSAEAQSRRFTHEWNTVMDWICKMQKKPTMPKPISVGTIQMVTSSHYPS